MLVYCELDLQEETSGKLESELQIFSFMNMQWRHLSKGRWVDKTNEKISLSTFDAYRRQCGQSYELMACCCLRILLLYQKFHQDAKVLDQWYIVIRKSIVYVYRIWQYKILGGKCQEFEVSAKRAPNFSQLYQQQEKSWTFLMKWATSLYPITYWNNIRGNHIDVYYHQIITLIFCKCVIYNQQLISYSRRAGQRNTTWNKYQ